MQAGDKFLIQFTHAGPKAHLWILLTDPLKAQPVVLVSVTTLRHGKDQTVVLQKGDHPWVQHPSCVHYGDAVEADQARLQEWIDAKLAIPQAPCSPELIALVRAGVRSSEHTPKKIIRLLDSL